MAHELTIRQNGNVEMAYLEGSATPWHKLGNVVPREAGIEEWITKAGMDWEVHRAKCKFISPAGLVDVEGKSVLYRSDNSADLSIVSDKFKIVQPREVIEFFRDLTELNGMILSTAGTLFGGKRFWALAETKDSFMLGDNDENKCYVLLMTAVDGSYATTGMLTSIRTVCNNTLNLALNSGATMVKTYHRQTFDPQKVKIDMGLVSESFYTYQETIKKLSEVQVDTNFAKKFITDLLKTPGVLMEDQPRTLNQNVGEILNKFRYGIGNNGETAFDLLNGVTEWTTHSGKQRSFDTRFNAVYTGKQAEIASKAFSNLQSAFA